MTHPLETALTGLVAALGQERAALAAFDYDALAESRAAKDAAAARVEAVPAHEGRAQLSVAGMRALAEEARVMNEANGAMLRLLIANVDARLNAMTGAVPLYRPGPAALIAHALA
jgi:hypothetical protein